MNRREVKRRLEDWQLSATEQRTALLAQLTALYTRRNVMTRNGRCCRLDRCCDSGPICWRTAQHDEYPGEKPSPPDEPDGSIFWPWIGEHYELGGLCVVAINLNLDTDTPEDDWWDITVEYGITDHVGEYLGAGRHTSPKWGPSRTGYRMAASAAAVSAWWEGRPPHPAVEPDPRTLVGFLEHIARVQAVKCSPRGRRAGQPAPAMWRQCPPRYLGAELAILRPGVLLVLGTAPRRALGALGETALEIDTPEFAYGSFTLGDLQPELFWLPHPNNRRGGWARGQRQLLSYLARTL
jgi:hypothetical protein